MLGDSINTLCCNPVVLKKKLVNPLKIAIFWPTETGSAWATPKMKNTFLAEITKADHSFQRFFILPKYDKPVFWLNYESIWCDMFCQKGSLPAKTAVGWPLDLLEWCFTTQVYLTL